MKKLSKRILAFMISLAMVASAFTFNVFEVKAAGLSQDEIDSIAGHGSMTNLFLNKTADVHYRVAEGLLGNLTNGSLTNGHCALSGGTGWGANAPAYFTIDLGDYYVASSLNELVLAYKDNNPNDTVINRTFSIQYSLDNITYDTKYTSDAVSSFNDDNATVTNISGFSGNVRFIRIYYNTTADYGIQLTEAAVLATNPTHPSGGTCANPSAVVAQSDKPGEISFSITPGANQEDYIYSARLDSPQGELLNNYCLGNATYTYEVSSGNHSIFVQSHHGIDVSEGIYSNTVSVVTFETLASDGNYNYAYGKDYTISSGTPTEGNGSITNGTISNGDYVTADKGQAGSWQCIDLGNSYTASRFENVVVWFRSNVGGTFPETNCGIIIQYSADGSQWRDVVTLTQSQFNEQVTGAQPFPIITDVSEASGEVRYVRAYFPAAVAYGAQITEIGVFDLDASTETVVNPDNFTAVSSSYNTITGTITAATGHSDYKYNVYLNDTLTLSGIDAGSYTINHLDAGTYEVKCKSVHNNHKSDGISVSNVVVASGFTYTDTVGTGLFPDTNNNLNNYVRKSGMTIPGVTATESSKANDGSSGLAAIDNDPGTRWESLQSDPQWIQVDLGSVKSVKEIDMWWETANSKDFTINVSSNGIDYTEVAFVNGASAGGNRRDSIVLTSATNARYIKVYSSARNTDFGNSIWDMAIYGTGSTPNLCTVTIDGTQLAELLEGATYTMPNVGMTEYAENGYYLNSDPSKAYAPGDQIVVNGNLAFTAIDYLSVVNGDGASIRMDKSNPGLSFKVTYDLNHSDPVMSSAFTYGALITTLDLYFDKYSEDLIIDNSGDQANVVVKSQSDWYSYEDSVIRPGIMRIRPYNITREFVCRGYVKINYVSGQSKIIYATNPNGVNRVRSVSQIAIMVKNRTEYYNSLSASEKEAVDYFAEQ